MNGELCDDCVDAEADRQLALLEEEPAYCHRCFADLPSDRSEDVADDGSWARISQGGNTADFCEGCARGLREYVHGRPTPEEERMMKELNGLRRKLAAMSEIPSGPTAGHHDETARMPALEEE
jgi:hypothetical protein